MVEYLLRYAELRAESWQLGVWRKENRYLPMDFTGLD